MFVLLAQDAVTVSPAILTLLVIGVVVQFSFNAFVAIALNRINKQDRDVESLKQQLHTTTEKLIDERLRSMTHQVGGSINNLVLSLEEMKGRLEETKARLKESEGGMDGLGERDHRLELKVLQGLADLKANVMERMATKDDLRDHQKDMTLKVDRINEHLGQQDRKLASIEAQGGGGTAGRRGNG